MQETTIDIGIDLGTTNSVIAVMNAGQVEVVKNGMSEMTPSCLYINKKGISQVGAAAQNRLADENSTLDVQFEVKRLMGQHVDLRFESFDRAMSPEEVSAEVLVALRKAAEQRFSEMPRAAIITIPAMFETPQREATARAAKLAGFEHFQLLQEPVAAAVSYGFRSDADKVFWLVYDFGGGTFDASIVSIRDGELSVVDHEGDNYLGGSDFDWVIVEQFLVPQLKDEYDLSRLSRAAMNDDKSVRAKMFKLKVMAERLKIELSRETEATLIEENVLRDDAGREVDLDISLTRDEFNHLIDGMVDQSIQVVEKLLKNSRLAPKDIQKVLLVGGSTFIPRIRERVAALGMGVDYNLDPMTVVARGAAIFAASQRMPEGQNQPAQAVGSARLKLEYNPVSKDINPLVGGKVTLGGGATLGSGTTVELSRTNPEGWTSGSIPVDASGMFFTDVMVVENEASTFSISIRDRESRGIAITPSQFTITHGLSVAKPTLPQSIRLARYDGSSMLLLQRGSQLPARIDSFRVRSTKALSKGDAHDELHIPFVEGEEDLASRNRVGMRLVIRGDQVDRSLPENTELEISASIDASAVSHFHVFVPLLDEQFETAFTDLEHEPPDVMENRLRAAMKRIEDLGDKSVELDNAAISEQLTSPPVNDRVDSIRRNVAAWKGGDHSAAGRARNLQLELDKELDEISGKVEWPALLMEYREVLDKARQIVHEDGDEKTRSMLSRLEHEGNRAIEDHDVKMLQAAHSEIVSVYMAILAENPAFWVAMLQNISEESHLIPDRAKANTLIKEGMQAVKREDVASLRSIVSELFQLMPREDAARIQAVRSDVS